MIETLGEGEIREDAALGRAVSRAPLESTVAANQTTDLAHASELAVPEFSRNAQCATCMLFQFGDDGKDGETADVWGAAMDGIGLRVVPATALGMGQAPHLVLVTEDFPGSAVGAAAPSDFDRGVCYAPPDLVKRLADTNYIGAISEACCRALQAAEGCDACDRGGVGIPCSAFVADSCVFVVDLRGSGTAGASTLKDAQWLPPSASSRLELTAGILENALGVGMFRFDAIIGGVEVDGPLRLLRLGLMPDRHFERCAAVATAVAVHLFEQCQQRALRVDIRCAIANPRLAVALVLAQHPDCVGVDRDSVDVQVLSRNIAGEKTSLVARMHLAEGAAPLICRLRGATERVAFEYAVACAVSDAPVVPLMGSYFGSRVVIGFAEMAIQGRPLQEVVSQVNRRRLCRNIGALLRKLHAKSFDVQSPDYVGEPLCVSRLRANAVAAHEAARHVEQLRPMLGEILAAALNSDIGKLPEEARKEVFGHFDVNLGNVLVDEGAPLVEAPRVHLVDWEQAGTNIAAYDLAKFIVSYIIAVEVDDAAFQIMMDDLSQGYAPDWDEDARRRFILGVQAMLPYVAALNFMSNIRHAAEGGNEHWVNRGLQHYAAWRRFRFAWGLVEDLPQSGPVEDDSLGKQVVGELGRRRRLAKSMARSCVAIVAQ
mmetsp:Transcript_60926/g.176250  ORF Transcript_60926/g.176250 Transcript_60926/m.176250 type:complete len:657 (+) Transcript_60926:90-2060(+)|eukprot:CAMPEP_0170228272 /NCGR_PEP_ID=MMETSP0116_2-20130129/13854_1 /TAXON_ID=400756 /ORGANISM="Durinskia baltica, Strain CSIRO CS-38" /LENGTH=656 /DNA_ID=CAMNT_0010479011 /DNA_START=86 /DNA_END=2056 /DNA_ORIENTATION=-